MAAEGIRVTIIDDTRGHQCSECYAGETSAADIAFVCERLKARFGAAVAVEYIDLALPRDDEAGTGLLARVKANGLPLPIIAINDVPRLSGAIAYRPIAEAVDATCEVSLGQYYDVVIIGGGPAGLTAAIYCARARRRTLIIERAVTGGQIAIVDRVENYPGFPDGISGFELGERLRQQAERFGAELRSAEVTGVELAEKLKLVKTDDGGYAAKALIIAGGCSLAKLDVPGEARLTGRGVSYCATCDGPFFAGETIAVVGGGDAAIEEALYLTRYAEKITVIHRRDQLRATAILQERAFANSKIDFLWNSVVEEVQGRAEVERLQVRDVQTGVQSSLPVSGVFVFVGLRPNTDYLEGVLNLGAGGFIPVDIQMQTEVPGIFAAGDIRQHSPRQVVAATGDGAVAAISAEHYLNEHW